MPAAAAIGRSWSTASSTRISTGTGRRFGASWVSMRLRSRRSSTMRARRSASLTMRSANGRVTAGSVSDASVSASTSSAPIGVFSSWLTLATKSRRTLSIRWMSDTSDTNAAAPSGDSAAPSGTALRCTTARGGPNSCSSRSHRSPASARANSASMAPATTASEWRGLAVALGRRIPEHLAAVGRRGRRRRRGARRARRNRGPAAPRPVRSSRSPPPARVPAPAARAVAGSSSSRTAP